MGGCILGTIVLITSLNYNHKRTNSDVYFNITYQDVQNIIIHTLIDITISVEFADKIVNIYRKDTLCTPEYINQSAYEFKNLFKKEKIN
tara:strand:+ start:1103 stop:1369 length:267 start_codon:yes stop_codon:yes gene_type:complete